MKTITGITDELNYNQLSNLDSFVMLYNKISHTLYVDLFIKKLPIKDLSPIYQKKYGISKRHFDSIRKTLEGNVSSILALNKNYILDTQEQIKNIEKELSAQKKIYKKYKDNFKKELEKELEKQPDANDIENSLVEDINNNINNNLYKKLQTKILYNQQRLDRLKNKLKRLENICDSGNAHLCFGSNKLFKQQFNIGVNQNPFKTHKDWYKAWNYSRNKEVTLIGSKDETSGNCNCQITYIKENLFNLKININHNADKITDKYVNLTFTIHHELETLKQIINNNNSNNKLLWQALTYKLIKQPEKSHNEHKYVIAISFEKHLVKKTLTSKDNGCIGVDINQDHLAISNLDNKGNLLNIYTYRYDLNGTKHQNINSISLAVKNLISLANKLNKPVVIEKLDFTQKKKSLNKYKSNYNNQYIKNRNKQLSSFAYSKIIELIKSRAEDNYVEVKEVNPAYTSIIGSIKYSSRSRISMHHGAAMCIGRKGLFNIYSNNSSNNSKDKKLLKEYVEKRISVKNKQIKTSCLPVRKDLKSVVYWKELKENVKKQQQYEKICSINPAKNSTSLGYKCSMPIPVSNDSIGTTS